MTTPGIEAIIFDLGRVLVAIDNTLLVEQVFKGLSTHDPLFVQKAIRNKHMVAFNTGRISPQAFHQRMCDEFGLNMDYDTFMPLWCSIFYPMEGMEELVRQLKKHLKIGLLSDTDPLHWNHIITNWPWIDTIENPTLSFEVGVIKPNAKIYLKAAENVNTPPEKCLFIDDLQANVEGALAVGMNAVRFESVYQLQELLGQKNML